ncbi:MAG: small, acid-soluble spore protein, alpha/beta type [Paenibacillaceae bacterium]|nr:small, acid-soluble spore protein, alpha/beta type [Paenibacillaceae bacterium]
MSRRRGTMSESFKYELAKDLGFKQKVERDGWGAITTKEAGNMVKRAIQLAEQSLAGSPSQAAPQSGAAARGSSAPSYGAQTAQQHAQPRHMQ